jgi:predicted alpha/beta superfamily hydrolase
MPRLAADYRVADRWLVGHSFSGLFGLRVLFTEPDLFDKYLLASPSIWWHDRAILELEEAHAAAHDDLAARVFLSAGDLEDDQFGQAYRMGGNVRELTGRLAGRGYANLEISHVVLPEENHSSTIGAAISHGLRALS